MMRYDIIYKFKNLGNVNTISVIYLRNYYAQDTHQRVPMVNSNAQLINRIGIVN